MEEEKKETPLKAPPHFVLIHGISGGSWCWYKMKSLMYNSGYMVTCIDLKVYVAATMLKNGFLTEQDVKDGAPDLSEYGDAYDLEFGLGSTQPPTTGTVKKELQRKLLYHMSPPEDYMLASMLLRPGPIYAIQSAQFPEGNEDVEKVPRVYIKTMYDRVIKPEQQDNMIAKWTPSQVYVLESDHSPNFSSPFALFGLLVKIAASIGGT
ncbi:hypothetical protein Ccrd_016874 [Cynara cardunculus var. scolymus]|uniref:AB hydrolase-1 domain-containing protein n=1 Tax=Cynara cardunculus var. scolymus TaxID=59895 RepID=A0A103Y952_CYNCS|nr:hypothetical protein Ccrd_016874 [Cynara cardunculus var. scolymus]